MTWRLSPILRRAAEEAASETLYADLEMPLIDVLAGMESNGIKRRLDVLARARSKYGELLRARAGDL